MPIFRVCARIKQAVDVNAYFYFLVDYPSSMIE